MKKHTNILVNYTKKKAFVEHITPNIMNILNYLIHFELGNYDLLENIRLTIIKHLKEIKRPSDFDNLLLEFFNTRNQIENMLSNTQLLREYITKMKKIITNTPQEPTVKDVNIIAWLMSKRDKNSFIDALRLYKQEI